MAENRAVLDPAPLLVALAQRGVDYVVIGGIAAVLHGSAQNTFDLDITFATDHTNLELLGEVLVGLGASLRAGSEDVPFAPDATLLRRVEVLTMNTSLGMLDILANPKGAPGYAQLRAHARRVRLGDVGVLIASIEDLIAMKLAAGRPKDLVAVEELETIRRLTGSAAR